MRKPTLLIVMGIVSVLIATASGTAASGQIQLLGGGAIQVQIDVAPGSINNTIDLSSNGAVPVAIYGSNNFNVMRIDASSVKFAGAAIPVSNNGIPQYWFRDINNDGYTDFVANFRIGELNLSTSSTQAALTGVIVSQFQGVSPVSVINGTVPPPSPTPTPTPTPAPIPGYNYDLYVGMEFQINLRQELGSNSEWKLEKSLNENILKLTSQQFQLPPGGVVGTRIFNFQAAGPGSTQIYLGNRYEHLVYTIRVHAVTPTPTPGSTIRINSGLFFVASLEANPSTGYHWELAQPLNTAIVIFISNEFKANNPALLGSPGFETWKFQGVAHGQTEIVLNYLAPNGSVAKTVRMNVIVN